MSLNDFACLFKQTLVIHLYTNKSFTKLNPPEPQEHLVGCNPEEISGASKIGSTLTQLFCAETFFAERISFVLFVFLHPQPKLISTVQYHTVLKSMIPVPPLGNKSIIVKTRGCDVQESID